MENNAWYQISNVADVDSPALIIYPDRVDNNIKLAKTFVQDVHHLRPHIKTNKSPEVVRLMMEAGITKFKCATLAEAELLGMQGAEDVLLAYQPVGPKSERFTMLQKHFPATAFSCLIDNADTAKMLSEISRKNHLTSRVFIDLNVGMNRTGIKPGTEALEFYLYASTLENIEVVGLHAYDGHHRDPELTVRANKCNEGFKAVEQLREEIIAKTENEPIVIAGGTPTFPIHARRRDVECSPGTFVFWDKGYQQILKEQPFQFAALVLTRVISIPDNNTICIDLGHKSIASENALTSRVFFLNAPDLEPIGHSEEHMVLKAKPGHQYKVGDLLYGVPYHICPTVALHDVGWVCHNQVVSESWSILARRRRITI